MQVTIRVPRNNNHFFGEKCDLECDLEGAIRGVGQT